MTSHSCIRSSVLYGEKRQQSILYPAVQIRYDRGSQQPNPKIHNYLSQDCPKSQHRILRIVCDGDGLEAERTQSSVHSPSTSNLISVGLRALAFRPPPLPSFLLVVSTATAASFPLNCSAAAAAACFSRPRFRSVIGSGMTNGLRRPDTC